MKLSDIKFIHKASKDNWLALLFFILALAIFGLFIVIPVAYEFYDLHSYKIHRFQILANQKRINANLTPISERVALLQKNTNHDNYFFHDDNDALIGAKIQETIKAAAKNSNITINDIQNDITRKGKVFNQVFINFHFITTLESLDIFLSKFNEVMPIVFIDELQITQARPTNFRADGSSDQNNVLNVSIKAYGLMDPQKP